MKAEKWGERVRIRAYMSAEEWAGVEALAHETEFETKAVFDAIWRAGQVLVLSDLRNAGAQYGKVGMQGAMLRLSKRPPPLGINGEAGRPL